MIKARVQTANGEFALVGLERKNVDRLVAGDPILLDLADIEMKGVVVIAFGETAQDLLDTLQNMNPKIPDLKMPGPTDDPVLWKG